MAGFFDVAQRLDRAEIRYMIVGSVASMVYGEPRLTHDLDLVVELRPSDVARFLPLFPESEFYCPPAEVIRAETVQRGQFNLIQHATGLKIDLVIRKHRDFALEEFLRRRKVEVMPGVAVFLASPEDVILKKLDFYREGGSAKHLTDIRGILANTEVDRAYLDRWIDALNLRKPWAEVEG